MLVSACGAAAPIAQPSDSGSAIEGRQDVPTVRVDAPPGWRPQTAHWSVNTLEQGGFTFMDQSYVSASVADGVYVCVEALEHAACPDDDARTIRSQVQDAYRLVIVVEERSTAGANDETKQAWANAVVTISQQGAALRHRRD